MDEAASLAFFGNADPLVDREDRPDSSERDEVLAAPALPNSEWDQSRSVCRDLAGEVLDLSCAFPLAGFPALEALLRGASEPEREPVVDEEERAGLA